MAKKQTEKLPAVRVNKQSQLPDRINEKELEYVKDYGVIPKHYINNTLVTTSLYDVKFVFGQMLSSEGNKVTVDPEVMVMMSPQHAKALIVMLERQLKAYEQRNGPIPVNPDNKP